MNSKSPTINYLSLIGGFVALVGVGLFAITNDWLSLSHQNFWPGYIILIGIFILLSVNKRMTEQLRAWIVTLGSFIALIGVFFLPFSLGAASWSEMNAYWPMYIIIPGVAALCGNFAAGRSFKGLLLSGVLLLAAGIICLFFTKIGSISNLENMWPLFVVLAGLVIFISGRTRAH